MSPVKLFKMAIGYMKGGHPRSQNLKKNISASFVLKAIAIVISLIRVPILLTYLNADKYGVWLTIASILEWMSIFDLGLGHGFRNRFAEALALQDFDRAKGLVSTAYVSMSAIMLVVFSMSVPVIFVLNWGKVLNTNFIPNGELQASILMVSAVFAARFVLQLASVMLKALQKSALSDVFLPVSSVLSLALIPLMSFYVKDSLFWASAVIAIPPILVLIVANIILFYGHYAKFRPALPNFDKRYLGDIYSLGWKFFVGQIGSLILFSSSNIILAQAINPKEVTVYNIANKYFSLPISYFMIIVTPYWSAVTDAYVKKEFDWIKGNMRKIMYVASVFGIMIFIMLSVSQVAFRFWVGDRVSIPWRLSIMLAIYNIGVVFLAPYTMFSNGFGKLKLGTIVAPLKVLLYVPLAWFFAKSYGAFGLVLALLLVNLLPNCYIDIKQYTLIVGNKAKGIWNL